MKKIAYLCSEYPAISHTFIFREVVSLREENINVATCSVHRSKALEIMTEEEQQEAAATMVMFDTPILTMLIIPFKLFFRSPVGFAKMTLQALSIYFKIPKSFIKVLGYLGEAMILVDWLQKKGINHIHEHFGNPTAIVAMLARTYGKITYSLSIHGPDVFYQVDSALLKEKVMGASFVRCISFYCRSQLWRITPYKAWSKFHIVRCGIDPWLYNPENHLRKSQGEILCVGRLTPAKGQHVLLEAAALLKEKKLKFHITIIGDGEDKDSLNQLQKKLGLEDHVHFTGALGQHEVRDYYRQADIFVLPSFAEGIPVVLMEAMAKEIPVISTRITGIPELINHGVNGLLTTPGNIEELAEQIEFLFSYSEETSQFGAAGRKTVVEKYNQQENNKELAKLFEKYGK